MEHIKDIIMLEILEGHGSDQDRKYFNSHISECEQCQKRWSEYLQISNNLSELKIDATEIDLFSAIAKQIQGKKEVKRPIYARTFVRVAASVFLSIALGHIIGKVSTHNINQNRNISESNVNFLYALAPSSATGLSEHITVDNALESE
ncbi:MAG: hypothetical protein JEZ07_06150 [Phycisphaerae bacterium]|nr:hypothetical protein [Phycisphaerae bacterium]